MMRLERGVLSCLWVMAALGCGGEDTDMGGVGGGTGGTGGTGGMGGGSAAPTVTFTQDIHPILQMSCATSNNCHGTAGFIPGHADPDVDVAYMEVTRAASGGTPVYEVILLRTASTDPGYVMPPNYNTPACMGGLGTPGCLTQEQYDLIKEWVEQGHPK
ncbi:MAG: hypothetical protein ABI895_06970 [Deltaproteobacteria bacterium]